MSREISIGYRYCDGRETDIEVRAPYFLLGCQETSKRFWSLPELGEVGITRLTELGVCDPVYFIGWDMVADLRRELDILHEHLASIDFAVELKASWLAHLVYCFHLLILTAPKDSTPMFTIG